MSLSVEDKRWITKTVRRILAEVIAEEAQHGGYDGATAVTDDDWSEEGKKGKRRRIGFELDKG